ncbi:hypothetical protein [Oceanobacillus saliphilus]|uniref:hypothetical protein n=1 Tax=Oceanobacillus saliphilus TaxID=2925834 RepID=UPI00201D6BE8|nr:hypothetical protein [Oceanobacillus saliphilus]
MQRQDGMNMQHPMAYPSMNEMPMQMHEGTMGDYSHGHSHHREMFDFCNKHRDHYVMVETTDGKVYDGIIINVDAENVQILMPMGDQRPEDSNENGENRQFGFGGGFGYPPYGGFGRVPFRFRRFRPFPFPFLGIRRLFFPFFY